MKMYHLLNRGGPLIEQEIGEWTRSGGLTIFEADMWRRRANLHGAVVRKVFLQGDTSP